MGFRRTPVSKITLDLHPIFRNSRDIDVALNQVILRAASTEVQLVELIPGKGSGQLKKRVLTFLARRHIRTMYDRVETPADNEGRVLVYFSDRLNACSSSRGRTRPGKR
jgi:DNA-nicking Smr family endonuclease